MLLVLIVRWVHTSPFLLLCVNRSSDHENRRQIWPKGSRLEVWGRHPVSAVNVCSLMSRQLTPHEWNSRVVHLRSKSWLIDLLVSIVCEPYDHLTGPVDEHSTSHWVHCQMSLSYYKRLKKMRCLNLRHLLSKHQWMRSGETHRNTWLRSYKPVSSDMMWYENRTHLKQVCSLAASTRKVKTCESTSTNEHRPVTTHHNMTITRRRHHIMRGWAWPNQLSTLH